MIAYDGANPDLTRIAQSVAESAYREGYSAPEEDALGLAVAKHYRHDGSAVLRTFFSALEDCNYHPEAATVAEWIKREEVGQVLHAALDKLDREDPRHDDRGTWYSEGDELNHM